MARQTFKDTIKANKDEHPTTEDSAHHTSIESVRYVELWAFTYAALMFMMLIIFACKVALQ